MFKTKCRPAVDDGNVPVNADNPLRSEFILKESKMCACANSLKKSKYKAVFYFPQYIRMTIYFTFLHDVCMTVYFTFLQYVSMIVYSTFLQCFSTSVYFTFLQYVSTSVYFTFLP